MFKSINEERKTFSKKVVDHLRELIDTGRIKPGEKLPPERDLAERMEVSRPTIREAFKILSAMGYIKIRQGSGVFVADHRERLDNIASILFIQSETILELFEVRKVLETEAAYWAAKRGTQDFLDEFLARTKEIYRKAVLEPDFASAGEREQFLSESDQSFHLAIADAAGNEVMLRIMNNLIDLLRESRIRSMKVPGRVEQSLGEHLLIVEAIASRDADLAKRRMFEHLSSVETALTKALGEIDLPQEDETT